MSRLKKLAAAASACLVIFTVFGFFVLPPILKSTLEGRLSESLHRRVVMEDVDVNPYVLSVTVTGLTIQQRESAERFLSFDKLYANFQIMSILKRALITKELRIERPHISIIRQEETRYNFSDLIQEDSSAQTPSKPLQFSLNNIRLVNGLVDVWDKPKDKKHQLAEINISIPSVSNFPYSVDIFVEPLFEARLNETPVSVKGKTKPFHDTLETVFDVNLKDINVPYYLPYVPMEQNFKVLSGYLDTKGTISYIQRQGAPAALSVSGDVLLRTAEIADEKDNPVLRIPLLQIGIAPTELFSKTIHLSKVLLESPELNIVIDKTGNMNINAMLPETKTEETTSEEDEDSSPLLIDADRIELAAGKVSFSDASGTEVFETTLSPVNMGIDHFSNAKDKRSAYDLSVQTAASEALKVVGELSVSPLMVEGELKLQGVPLSKYRPYYRDNINFLVEGGILALQTNFQFETVDDQPELSLSDASVSLDTVSLRMVDEKEPFFSVPILSVKETAMSLAKGELVIGEVFTEKGLLKCVVHKNGDLNLATLVPPPAESPQADVPESEKRWEVTLNRFSVDHYTIDGIDLTPAEPARFTLDRIKINGEKISTVQDGRGNIGLSCRLDKKAGISVKGMFGIDPLFADLNLQMKDVQIQQFQPYLENLLRLVVTAGSFATDGNLALRSSREKDVSVTYKGNVVISDLASVDQVNTDDFVKWKSLMLNNVEYGHNPDRIKIDEIALVDLFASLIVNPDQTSNLQTILNKNDEDKVVLHDEPDEAEEAPKSISIGKVSLKDGHVRFLDRSITPSYSADLVEIQGAISGLSSEETKLADVLLTAKIDNYAPLAITGKINPLKEDLFVDLQIDFKDMDLSPTTPYAGKYVGYSIEKGKLSLDLEYLIEKRKLTSQNNVFLDQLTFGDKVDSPDAVKLPVKLAVALLKNRQGEIDLHLPVTGDIDDPEFRVGKIILKMVMNLLAKAATSPFALLGAVFGGGEELSIVEFEYGRFNIDAESQKKLDTLAKALYDRPSLKLDIEGHVDIIGDKGGLEAYLFDKKLKAQKLKEMVKKGLPAIPVDEVTVEADEYETYLERAYKDEKFQKPTNIIGLAKKLPAPEMERLIREHTEVNDDDLRLLALQRAQGVKDFILRSGGIEAERIFLIEPKSLAPDSKEGLKDSRVDLMLK